MIYLLPGSGSKAIVEGAAESEPFGVLLQPARKQRRSLASAYRWVAADNACFSLGARFDLGYWRRWLAHLAEYREKVLFVAAPDVVGDWAATWERSRPELELIRGLGLRPALVAQNGAEAASWPWEEEAAVFVGGTDEYKEGEAAAELCLEAKRRGAHVHIGRVNSRRRIRMARRLGADSVDGTHLAYKPEVRLRQLREWMAEANAQGYLEELTLSAGR